MVKKIEYKVNQKVGDNGVTYVSSAPNHTGTRPIRRCIFKCRCGTEFNSILSHVVSGNKLSCGCMAKEHLIKMSEANVTHRLSGHPIYKIWSGVVTRCTNEKHNTYLNYGAKGITVCDEWKEDCKSFIEWAEKNGWAKGLQIDRIDNKGNYSPLNCRFVTPLINSRNKSAPKNSKFGIAGITFEQNKYRVRVNVKGKKVNIGSYYDFFEACCARKSAEIRLWAD